MKRGQTATLNTSARLCSRLDEIDFQLHNLHQRKAALESYYGTTKGISSKRDECLSKVDTLIAELETERTHYVPVAAPATETKKQKQAAAGKSRKATNSAAGVFHAFDTEAFALDIVTQLKFYVDAVLSDSLSLWTFGPRSNHALPAVPTAPCRSVISPSDLEFFTWMVVNIQDADVTYACLANSAFPLDFISPVLANSAAEILEGITLPLFTVVFKRAVYNAHRAASESICAAVRESVIVDFFTEEDNENDKSDNQILFQQILKLGWTDISERIMSLSEKVKEELLVPCSLHPILRIMTPSLLEKDHLTSIFSPPSLVPSYLGFTVTYLSPQCLRLAPEPDNTTTCLTHVNVRCDTPFIWGAANTFSLDIPVQVLQNDFAFFRVGFVLQQFSALGECAGEAQLIGGCGESIAFSIIPHNEPSVLSSHYNAPSSALRAASASGSLRTQSHSKRSGAATAHSGNFRSRVVSIWSAVGENEKSSRKFVVLKHSNGVTQHVSDPPVILHLPNEESTLKFTVTADCDCGSISLQVGDSCFPAVFDSEVVKRPSADQHHIFQGVLFPAASLPIPDAAPYDANFSWENCISDNQCFSDTVWSGNHRKGSYLLRTVTNTILNRGNISRELNLTAKRILNKKESIGADILIPVVFDIDHVTEDHSVEFLTQRSTQLPDETLKSFFPGHLRGEGTEMLHYFVRRLPTCVCSPLVAAIHLRHYHEALFLVSVSPLISIDIPDDFGNSPLILSVLHGQLALARHLVFARNASLAPVNSFGLNALQIALQNGQLGILRMFLEHPTAVSADIVNATTRSGSNSVALCVKLHLFDFLPDLLARGGNPALPDLQGVSPVLFCLRHHLVTQVKLLLRHCNHSHWNDLNVKEKPAPRGTCGLYAAALGDAEICQRLEALDVSVGATFDNNFNVLHAAVIGNIPQDAFCVILSQAVRRKVNINAAEKRNYKTPLHYALERGRIDMTVELVKAGADVNVETKQGFSALALAILSSTEKNALDFFYASRRAGLSVDASDSQGFTALHHAARRGYCALISTLIELGKADINAVAGGETPIMTAVAYGHVEAAEVILNIANRRIELHSLRSNISTLVQSAFDMGMYRFCRALIAAGAESAPDLTLAIRRKPQRDEVLKELARADLPLLDDSRHLAFLTPACALCNARSFFAFATQKASSRQLDRTKLIASFFGEEGNPCADVYFDLCLHLVKHFGSLSMALHQLQYSSLSPSTSPRASPRARALEPAFAKSPPAADLPLDSSPHHSPPSRVDLVATLTDIFHGYFPSVVDAPSLRAHSDTATAMLQAAELRAEDTRGDAQSLVGWEYLLPFPTAMFFHLIRSGCSDPDVFLRTINDAGDFNVNAVAQSKTEKLTLLETAAECGNAVAMRILLRLGALIVTENDATDVGNHVWNGSVSMRLPRSICCAIRSRSRDVAAVFIDHMMEHPHHAVEPFSKADLPHFMTIALGSNLFCTCVDLLLDLASRHQFLIFNSDPFLMMPPLAAAVVWGRGDFVTRALLALGETPGISNPVFSDLPDLASADVFFHDINCGKVTLPKVLGAKNIVNVGVFRCPAAVPSLLRKGFYSSLGVPSREVGATTGTPPPPPGAAGGGKTVPAASQPSPSTPQVSPLAKPSPSPPSKRSRSVARKQKDDGMTLDDTDIALHVALKRLRVVSKESVQARSALFQESSASFDHDHISKLAYHRAHSSRACFSERVALEELVAYLCSHPTVTNQSKLKNASGQCILHLAALTGSPRAMESCFQHFTEDLTVFHSELAELNSTKGLPTPSLAQLRSIELLEKDGENMSVVDYFVRSRCFHGDLLVLLLDGIVSAKEKYSLLERIFRELHPATLAEMMFAHNAHQLMSCPLDVSGSSGSIVIEAPSLASSISRACCRLETALWFGLASLSVTGKDSQRSNIAKKIAALSVKSNFVLLCPTFLSTLILSVSYFTTQVALDPALNPMTRLTKNSLRNSISLKSALAPFGIVLSDQESEIKLAQTTAERYAFNLYVPIADSTAHASFVETTSFMWCPKGRLLAGPNAPVLPSHLSVDALAGLFLQLICTLGQVLDKNPRQEAARANQQKGTNASAAPVAHVSPVMQQRRLTEEMFPVWLQEIITAACRCGMVLVVAALRHCLLTIPGSEPEKRIVPSVLLAPSSAFTAAVFKRHEVLRYLLNLGVAPTLQEESNSMTLLDMVISHVSEDSINSLQQACRGCVLILLSHRALISPAAVTFFVEHPKIFDVNASTPTFRDTLLHIAVIHSALLVVEVLLNSPTFVAANALNKFDLTAYEYITEKRLIEPVGRLMLYAAAMHGRGYNGRSGSRSRSEEEPAVVADRRPTFSDADSGVPLVQFRVAIVSKRTFLRKKSTRVGGPADVIPMHCISPILRGPFLSEGESVDGRFTTFHSEMAVLKISMPLALIIHHLTMFSEGSSTSSVNQQQALASSQQASSQVTQNQSNVNSADQVDHDRNPYQALRLSQAQQLQLQQCKSTKNASAGKAAPEAVELIVLTDIQKELIVSAVVQNILGDAVLASSSDLIVDGDSSQRECYSSVRERASSVVSSGGGGVGDEYSPSASGIGGIAPSKPSAVVCLIPMYSMKKAS